MDNFNQWFLNPIKHQFFDFDGRATRQQYWMFVLWLFILGFVGGMVAGVVGLGNSVENILALITLVPSLAFATRRLHDIGRSGWWQLLYFVPIVGWIILLVWHIRQGSSGPNQYGPDPRASVSEIPSPVSVSQNPE